jgi:transcriptional regulator with XRE-family HTH domain
MPLARSRRRNVIGEVVLMRINPSALVALREKDGYGQAAFAAALDISKGHLHDIENGRRNPSAALVKKMADRLAVPMSAFAQEEVVA